MKFLLIFDLLLLMVCMVLCIKGLMDGKYFYFALNFINCILYVSLVKRLVDIERGL